MYLKTDEVNLGETNVTTMSTRGDFQLCKFQAVIIVQKQQDR